jgi:1-phosphofructokinase family hexose kinase
MKLFLCVSLNPAIDKRVTVSRLELGGVNRAVTSVAAPGGKAAHVAMVLQILGAKVTWTGLYGGPAGAILLEGLRNLGIRTRGVPIGGTTRTNLEILDDDRTVTELLEPGPQVTSAEISQLERTCEEFLRVNDRPSAVIFSGSLPQGAPANSYSRLIQLAHRYDAKVFLDTSGEPLRRALEARPDFVKANQSEISDITGMPTLDLQDVGTALDKTIAAGAQSAAISLGERGLAWQPGPTLPALYAPALQVDVTSAVGSGDAALAGFAFAWGTRLDYATTLQLAVACGAANCLAVLPGQPRKCDIDSLREKATVSPLESLANDGSLRSC